MKSFGLLVAAFALVVTMVFTAGTADAAPKNQTAGALLAGLINVNLQNVAVDVTTGDITLVNVEDVLNDAKIDILNNSINNNEVASRNQDFLNNLLRDAEILTDNQVVVGVLSGGQIVFQNV